VATTPTTSKMLAATEIVHALLFMTGFALFESSGGFRNRLPEPCARIPRILACAGMSRLERWGSAARAAEPPRVVLTSWNFHTRGWLIVMPWKEFVSGAVELDPERVVLGGAGSRRRQGESGRERRGRLLADGVERDARR